MPEKIGNCQEKYQKLIFYFISLNKNVREGNGTPLQYSCLENPKDGEAWKAAVHGVAEGRTRLSDFTFTFHFHFSLSLFTFMHWRRKWQPTPVFLPGESQGWQSLVGCRLRRRTELDMTEATQQQQRNSKPLNSIKKVKRTQLTSYPEITRHIHMYGYLQAQVCNFTEVV